jgi:hypothetical protein
MKKEATYVARAKQGDGWYLVRICEDTETVIAEGFFTRQEALRYAEEIYEVGK